MIGYLKAKRDDVFQSTEYAEIKMRQGEYEAASAFYLRGIAIGMIALLTVMTGLQAKELVDGHEGENLVELKKPPRKRAVKKEVKGDE